MDGQLDLGGAGGRLGECRAGGAGGQPGARTDRPADRGGDQQCVRRPSTTAPGAAGARRRNRYPTSTTIRTRRATISQGTAVVPASPDADGTVSRLVAG
ncbi:hypothetical protein [Asanoa sp. NPDC050611]|uniref:hypothetical protein n=1 Tax=Asanoa sp. NPDC050611 TaxID=3157098 RepID=UPI0033F5B751